MAQHITLGHFRLLLEHDIRLGVSAAVSFTTSDQSHKIASAAILETLQNHTAWACRGNGLQLEIRFLAGGEPLRFCEQGHQLLLQCSKVLSKAELWMQLELTTVLGLDSTTDQKLYPRKSSILVMIRHALDEHPRPASSHKLAAGAAPSDIRPPPGVPVLGLTNVTVDIDFQTVRHPLAQSRKLATATNPLEGIANSQHQPLEDEMLFETEQDLLQFPKPSSLPVGFSRCWLCQHLDNADIIRLIDAALRLWICKEPSNLHQNIQLVYDNRLACLSDLAPALWSPGYLRAVSQRSCLLPTIHHAVYGIARKSAMGSNLHSKNESRNNSNGIVLQLEPVNSLAHPKIPGHRPGLSEKELRKNLWQNTQRNLHRVTAACKLKPLESFDTKATTNIIPEDFLLDGNELDQSTTDLSFHRLRDETIVHPSETHIWRRRKLPEVHNDFSAYSNIPLDALATMTRTWSSYDHVMNEDMFAFTKQDHNAAVANDAYGEETCGTDVALDRRASISGVTEQSDLLMSEAARSRVGSVSAFSDILFDDNEDAADTDQKVRHGIMGHSIERSGLSSEDEEMLDHC